jgi:hypothetical protein
METPEPKVTMSLEDAYFLKKQTSLKLHRHPCELICKTFSPYIQKHHIDLDNYAGLLARLGLLNEDFPQQDS